eukprot:12891284-Alexandrium_andersonii.AAC.1
MGAHLVSHGKLYPAGQARVPGPSASQGRDQHDGCGRVFVLQTLNVTSFTRYLPDLQACDVRYTIMQERPPEGQLEQLRAAGRYASYLLYTDEGVPVRVFVVYCWAGAAEKIQIRGRNAAMLAE